MNKKKIIAGLISAVTAFSTLGAISANAGMLFNGVVRYDLTMDRVMIAYEGHRPSEWYRRGDVNGDDKLNVTDIVKLNAFIKGKNGLTPQEICRADVNGDKWIDATDVEVLTAKIKGTKNFSEPIYHSISTSEVRFRIYY
ncbi:MAG: dockerin type I repeat-containing protein [Ruminococcus sp.]|nr:dockerin type I repeat-containing protein [Ruminococcus sp.]